MPFYHIHKFPLVALSNIPFRRHYSDYYDSYHEERIEVNYDEIFDDDLNIRSDLFTLHFKKLISPYERYDYNVFIPLPHMQLHLYITRREPAKEIEVIYPKYPKHLDDKLDELRNMLLPYINTLKALKTNYVALSDAWLATTRILLHDEKTSASIERVVKATANGPFEEPPASLLHWAARCNEVLTVKALISAPNCPIYSRCSKGNTALDWAVAAKAQDCIDILSKQQPNEVIAILQSENALAFGAQLQRHEAVIQKVQNQMPWLRLDDEPKASSSHDGSTAASNVQSFYQDQIPVPENQIAIFPAHVVPEHINVSERYRCPITKLIMVDPVSTKAQHTYEREAIKAWLDKKDSDPNTGNHLDDKTLTDNTLVRQIIDEFIEQHPVLKSSDEIYLPQSFLKNLRDALVKQDLYKVRDLIRRDKRLLARYLAPGRTAFHAACEVGTKEILEYILNNLSTEELNTLLALPRPDAWQPVVLNESLLTAATQGDIKEMESVLRLGADIETRDVEWKTPLCRAAQANQLDAVDLLLTNGSNISARDAKDNAPLDLAILEGFNPIIMRLLDQGLPSYQPTSPAGPKQFSYMSLKFIYEITRGQKIGNRAIATASNSSDSSSSTEPTPTTTTANSTGTAHRSGFFAPPSSPAAANDLSPAVEPVKIDSTDDLKKANKP